MAGKAENKDMKENKDLDTVENVTVETVPEEKEAVNVTAEAAPAQDAAKEASSGEETAAEAAPAKKKPARAKTRTAAKEAAPAKKTEKKSAPAEAAPVEETVKEDALDVAATKEKKADKKPARKKKPADEDEKSKEELQKELDGRKKKLLHSKVEFSDKLKNLLSDDIAKAKKKEKTRSAEIMGVFAKHNFYAGGFTPVELRTTLEDLGPTYVKIGQIMSSRVDMLPQSYCDELQKLRQNVKELDPEIAKAVIEQETGKKID